MNSEFLQQQLLWRYAAKHFDTSHPVAKEKVAQIVEAMRMAPSSFGLQSWKFVVVEDAALREKMREVSFDQPQLTEASHVIVVAHKKEVSEKDVDRYMESVAETRGMEIEQLAGFAGMVKGVTSGMSSEQVFAWTGKQSYIALGFGLLSAALLEVDACPMEGFDHEAVTSMLGLEEDGYYAAAYLALGHRSEEDETKDHPKVRYSEEVVIDWK